MTDDGTLYCDDCGLEVSDRFPHAHWLCFPGRTAKLRSDIIRSADNPEHTNSTHEGPVERPQGPEATETPPPEPAIAFAEAVDEDPRDGVPPLGEMLGPYPFSDWPVREVPPAAAGVYAIWDDGQLLYVGMSGRGRSQHDLENARSAGRKLGIFTRLEAHASGRRSGDQFCVYVADRIVLPSLVPAQVVQIASGELRFDELVRARVRDGMTFTFLLTNDGRSAARLEKEMRGGALGSVPLLNPLAAAEG